MILKCINSCQGFEDGELFTEEEFHILRNDIMGITLSLQVKYVKIKLENLDNFELING